MGNDLIQFHKTDSVLNDMQTIIESSQSRAVQSVNALLVQRNWLLGYRIAEEELNGERSENYGKEIIKTLSQKLTEQYGKGFDRTSLYRYIQFYKTYPNILQTVFGKSNSSNSEIVATVSQQSSSPTFEILDTPSPKSLLSWSHYLVRKALIKTIRW
jgi:hypothetical protein